MTQHPSYWPMPLGLLLGVALIYAEVMGVIDLGLWLAAALLALLALLVVFGLATLNAERPRDGRRN